MGPIGPIGGIGRPDCAGAALAAFFFGAGRFAALALPAPDAIPNNAASDAPLPLAGALPLIAIPYSYLTLLSRGFFFFAAADALRDEDARIAPADFKDTPCLDAIFFCTALNPRCLLTDISPYSLII